MPAHDNRRIFISYARSDGAELATRLQRDLTKSGFDVWLDTQRIAGGMVWTISIEQEIDMRQVTVALLTPGSYESQICRAEQLRTLRKGNRLIPVLGAAGADRPLHIEALHYLDFTDPDRYSQRLKELVADVCGDATATLTASFRTTPITYITAPPRVANYLERPEALHALRDALFMEDCRQPIALTALSGMGGIGKTVLAQAVTKDDLVQQAFPDGIVWITVGREVRQDFIEKMREVAKALGDDLSRYDRPLACQHQYQTTIANKAALIVVDDVWSKADIEPLLAESPRSRFLFTTRDASIGRFLGAREFRAELLDAAQSRELLARWAGLEVARLPDEADEVLGECAGLPLALAVIGAMLRGAPPEYWTDTLGLLRKVNISAIQEQLPPGQEGFFRAVEVSFRALAPNMQKRYMALAVLLDDITATMPILRAVWNTNEAEIRQISRHFVDRSLAQQEDSTGGIRLHDLQLDYVRALHPDPESLNLIHGAFHLSSHVIRKDPVQFASQIVGRLLPHQGTRTIEHFTTGIVKGAPQPWLRPLRSALHCPGTSLICTLDGHFSSVNAVAIRRDGRRAVSASSDGTLKVWDLDSGSELYTLKGHSSSVNSVAVSADGRRAVSASSDRTLKVWDLDRGSELHTLEGHYSSVNGVAVCANGRLAVSVSLDKTLRLWDLDTGRELYTLVKDASSVHTVAISADGRRAVGASDVGPSWDYALKVWDMDSRRVLCSLEGHTSVYTVAISGDGHKVVGASWNNTLTVWDLESGCELRTLEGHPASVRCVAVSEDGRRAVTASDDKTLKVWDLESGRQLRTLEGHSSSVLGVALTADGKRAVSASWDNTLKVWNLEEEHEVRTHFFSSARDVAVSGDGKTGVSASDNNTLTVWSLEKGQRLGTLAGHSSSVLTVAVSADGRRAVSASSDNTLKVWDLDSECELHTLAGHSSSVHCVAVSADGGRAVSASWDNRLKAWDLDNGLELHNLAGHSSSVLAVAVSADGARAVSASWDKTLKVWDLDSGRELFTMTGHSSSVFAVAISANGRRAVSASSDDTLKVWDLHSGRELRNLTGHSPSVHAVAVSPDGQRVVGASWDNTLTVWDLDTGTLLTTFTCDAAAISCAFIDGHKLIARDGLGRVHFLSLEESKLKR